MKTDTNADLTAVGSIFALLVLGGMYLHTVYTQTQTTIRLQNKVLEAQHLAIQLHNENKALNNAIYQMDSHINDLSNNLNYYKSLVNIKETLKDYSVEEQAIGLALAWTESSWNYNANHNSSAQGICGVVPEYWEDYLNQRNIQLNSVEACIAIYKYYKDQTDSRKQAIKEYKGIESTKHHYLVAKTLAIRDLILSKLKGN